MNPAFPINRPLTQEERDSALPRTPQPGVEPDQHLSLVHFNSTYIDWIDRRFLFRGGMNTLIGTVTFIAGNIGVFYWMNWIPWSLLRLRGDDWWFGILMSLPVYGMSAFLYYAGLRGEYFRYTYWPIRFNRKTRMVHVFRHRGAGGTLSVPWDQVFFHIGRGTKMPDLRDIRGEILEGDIVKDTFALGHVASIRSEHALLEMWELIRRYMDESPEAAGPDPLDRYIDLSVRPTLKNCLITMVGYYAGGNMPDFFKVLVSPFVALYTLTRWVVWHTCRTPVFPPEVEATCQVEPNDPNVWPVPPSSGEFATTVPGLMAHVEARARRRWEAERKQRGAWPFGDSNS